MDLEHPEIEGFDFRQQLAKSSRCVLWRAVQRTLERDVLVAVFTPEVMDDWVRADALFGMVRVLAQVKSELLPDVIDIARGAGVGYVVLEDGHAEPLMAVLAGQRPEPERVLRLGIRLAEGFASLHAHHLVYGGLRPSKVYLVEGSNPVLLDFSPITFEAGFGEQAPEQALMGSAPYVAPEQYLAPETVDTRADMFALGMTLYALCTGQVPFGAFAPEEILARKLREAIPSPCDVVEAFPPAFAAVLGRLTQRQAARRYGDWDEVLCDLHAVLRGDPPEGAGGSDSVIAPPNPNRRQRAERTIRLSAAELRAYRHKSFQRKGMGLGGWLAVVGAVVLALAAAGALVMLFL